MTSSRNGGRREEKKLNLFCFFVSGLANLFGYSLMIIASEDILSGLTVPTSLVVICISGPASLAALTLPCFFDKIGQYKFTFSCISVCCKQLLDKNQDIIAEVHICQPS